LQALMGRAKWNEQRRRFGPAVEDLTMVSVLAPRFLPALIEKARLQMIKGEWDDALELADRILKRDPHNVDALRLFVLHVLSREAKVNAAMQRIAQLKAALEKNEPKNAALFYEISRLIARFANRKPQYGPDRTVPRTCTALQCTALHSSVRCAMS
jgi:tetratricopeptide repeat protein 21B